MMKGNWFVTVIYVYLLSTAASSLVTTEETEITCSLHDDANSRSVSSGTGNNTEREETSEEVTSVSAADDHLHGETEAKDEEEAQVLTQYQPPEQPTEETAVTQPKYTKNEEEEEAEEEREEEELFIPARTIRLYHEGESGKWWRQNIHIIWEK